MKTKTKTKLNLSHPKLPELLTLVSFTAGKRKRYGVITRVSYTSTLVFDQVQTNIRLNVYDGRKTYFLTPAQTSEMSKLECLLISPSLETWLSKH